MSDPDLKEQIGELKSRQEMARQAWLKAGNRDLLKFFVDIMPKAIEAERCSIFILDPISHKVWLQCGTGVEENEVIVPKSTSLVGRVISSGKSIIDDELRAKVGEHDVIAVRTGFVAYDAICVPIIGATTRKVVGAIQVLNKKRRNKFSDEDLSTIERLAFHISRNIEDIFLRQEMERISVELGSKILELEKLIVSKSG
ncbi:MAG: GAF AAA-type ATPase and DNA binding domain-containing transcriptional regulator [Gammaproteobacteria bacterium]|nr:MAG: GAF AAA-type ATPase and DNA binding domain-containing transcriptional regulator [Gammaproteobacteria bacterium]TND06883.1 MAG: GAF, AAA-type ATPase, and DNA binding domain-containing transcriptional regulator [Gammaproteobacteria bacterium]